MIKADVQKETVTLKPPNGQTERRKRGIMKLDFNIVFDCRIGGIYAVSYTHLVGTLAAGVLGITLVRAFVQNGPTSLMMTFQMTLLPALIMPVSYTHLDVYKRQGCVFVTAISDPAFPGFPPCRPDR